MMSAFYIKCKCYHGLNRTERYMFDEYMENAVVGIGRADIKEGRFENKLSGGIPNVLR